MLRIPHSCSFSFLVPSARQKNNFTVISCKSFQMTWQGQSAKVLDLKKLYLAGMIESKSMETQFNTLPDHATSKFRYKSTQNHDWANLLNVKYYLAT